MERGIKQVLIDEKIARLQAKVFNLNVVGTFPPHVGMRW